MNSPNLFKWIDRAAPPLARAGCAVGAHDGGIITAGGTYWQDGHKQWTDRVDRFDPVANRWSSLSPLPRARGDASAAVLDGHFYVMGGGTTGVGERTVHVLSKGKWDEVAALMLPEPRRSAVAVVVSETIYLLGGLAGAGTEFNTATATVWCAKSDGGWQDCPAMPGPPRFNAAVGVLGEKIMLAGGCTPDGSAVRNLDTVLSYDTRGRTWTEIARMPIPLRGAWGLADDTRLLVFGGYTDAFLTRIYAVDAITGAVSVVGDLPVALADARFVRLGDVILGVTGENGIKMRFPGTIEARAR
jgi:N-acetylneuraminic acid mutarotase